MYRRWTPYIYCKDNPIKFIDINGDSLKVNDVSQNNTATAKMDQMIDKKTNGYYKTTVDKNGNTTLTSTGKSDPKNPISNKGQAFVDQFNNLANSSDITTINITDNDNNILVVDPNKATIDVGDLKTVDDKNLPSKSGTGIMMHEITEQREIQNGGDGNLGHIFGIHSENVIDNSNRTNYKEGVTSSGLHVMMIDVKRSDGTMSQVLIYSKNKNVVGAIEK